jgi:hypothetical protein
LTGRCISSVRDRDVVKPVLNVPRAVTFAGKQPASHR